MNGKMIVLVATLVEALIATSRPRTVRAAAAEGAAEQLATVTSAMNSIRNVVFCKDLSGLR